jgi:predicted Zn finger-like uncharacterized protein
MIVTCTACKTRYLTDPAVLGLGGRRVRCAKCGHSWLQVPPADMPRRVDIVSPPAHAAAIPPPRFNLPAPYIPPRRRRHRYRVALAVAAVVLILIGAGYFARGEIIATWPTAKRVYELIGGLMGTPTSTLDVGNVQIGGRPLGGPDRAS